jgi:hypothetical protein
VRDETLGPKFETDVAERGPVLVKGDEQHLDLDRNGLSKLGAAAPENRKLAALYINFQ